MGQQRINATAAFELLRRRSQATNVKLRDIADKLIIDSTGEKPHHVSTAREH